MALPSVLPSDHKGFSTLELIIACAIFAITFTSLIVLVARAHDVTIATERSREAVRLGDALLSIARSHYESVFDAPFNFSNIQTDSDIFDVHTTITPLSQCAITISLDIQEKEGAKFYASFTTFIGSRENVIRYGNDCVIERPQTNWLHPKIASTLTLSQKITSVDALDSFAYFGLETFPYLAILDARNKEVPQSLLFQNGFTGEYPISDIDVARHNDKTIAYVARDTINGQLAIIDVTDPVMPLLLSTSSLSDVAGLYPGGYRLAYFDNHVYITTRDTQGPELHIINVEDPSSPYEYPSSIFLNLTVESMTIRIHEIDNVLRTIGYFATKANTRELLIYDFTDPYHPYEIATIDFPGIQDGGSVFIHGETLYFGRQFSSGSSELYLWNLFELIRTPTTPALYKSMGGSVRAIYAIADVLFLALTQPPSRKLQIWPSEKNMMMQQTTPSAFLNISSIKSQGMDYSDRALFIINDSGTTLWIITG